MHGYVCESDSRSTIPSFCLKIKETRNSSRSARLKKKQEKTKQNKQTNKKGHGHNVGCVVVSAAERSRVSMAEFVGGSELSGPVSLALYLDVSSMRSSDRQYVLSSLRPNGRCCRRLKRKVKYAAWIVGAEHCYYGRVGGLYQTKQTQGPLALRRFLTR